MSTQSWDFPVKKSKAKKPKLVEVTINQELNDCVREYVSLKGKLEAMQERMKEVRIPIEEALALRGEAMEIAGFICTLQPCERENFNLKEAKKHIKEELLAPYLSTSFYTQLRIKGKE